MRAQRRTRKLQLPLLPADRAATADLPICWLGDLTHGRTSDCFTVWQIACDCLVIFFFVLLADRTTGWKVEQYTSTVWLPIMYRCSIVQCSVNPARDFRLSPQCKLDLRPAVFLHSIYWQFLRTFRYRLSVPSASVRQQWTAWPLMIGPVDVGNTLPVYATNTLQERISHKPCSLLSSSPSWLV